MNRVIYLLLIFLTIPAFMFGIGQTEESDYREVSGTDNWEYDVPLQDLESGEYNLLIRAKDKANNESFAGPFNIVVDPESDLPIVSITNPASFMRVGGVLNIVGTARDDDGIGAVYLKINDGEYFQAKGQEFWSYELKPDELSDGQHKITAKAVDDNGLEGREISVLYNQDTLKPVNSIESHVNGEIFSGKVKINGKVIDANGISDISYSSDNQQSYQNIKFIENEEENFYTFQLEVDTKKIDDGPAIYWFKSKDKTGSVAFTAFLFFVDNEGPELTIIDPEVESSHNGIVSISGKIYDRIGVKKLYYQFGEKIVDIPLYSGNPYWTTKVDLSNETGKKTLVKFFSEDMSGNIKQVDFPLLIDNEADKPVLLLDSPVNEVIYKEELIIEGAILDDDYVDGIEVTIDNNEPEYIKTFNSFSIVKDSLKTGSHTLKIRAKDVNGIYGDLQTIKFGIEGRNPEILINSIGLNDKEDLFYPGYNVTIDDNYSILGSINSGNEIDTLYYTIEDSSDIELPFKAVGGAYTFNIPIDHLFNYGIVNFAVKATDIYGNSEIVKSNIYVKNYGVVNDEWDIYYRELPEDGVIKLNDKRDFQLYLHGPEVDKVTVIPENNIMDVTTRGKLLIVDGVTDGKIEGVKFRVESEKNSFTTDAFNFLVDKELPEIELVTPKNNTTQSGNIILRGEVKEISLETLEYKFSNEKEFTELNFSTGNNSYSFNKTLAIPETSSETLSIEIRATDRFGNRTNSVRSFLIAENKFVQTLTGEEIIGNTGKGSDKPVLFINFPYNNQTIFTQPILSGYARDDDNIKEIKITEAVEGGKVIKTDIDGLFDIPLIDFGSGNKSLLITAVDNSGVESSTKKISYKYVIERSNINLKLKAGDFISKDVDLTIKGNIVDPLDGELLYSFNGTEFKKVSFETGEFSIEVPDDLYWGRNDLTVKYIDRYKREIIKSEMFYFLDLSKTSKTVDENGIYFNDLRLSDEYIDLSSKNSLTGYFKGRTVKEITLKAESGKVPEFLTISGRGSKFVITSISDGISKNIRVEIETIDGDIYKSDYFKFISDDTLPDIKLESEDNQFIKGIFTLKGLVKDDLKLDAISYSINRGYSWVEMEQQVPKKPEEKESYTKTGVLDFLKVEEPEVKEFIFNSEIDLSTLDDSGYTVWIKAVDLKGNEVIKKLSFIKDNTNPQLELFIPGSDEINGIISLIGKSSDNIELKEITYSYDGIAFERVAVNGVYDFTIDFGSDELFPEKFVVKAEDMAGNHVELYPEFNIDQEKDKPVVEIQTPIDGEIIRNDFTISGMAFDDDSVATIYYSLDGGELQPVAQDKNNFSIDISLDSVENNEHVITVKAIDILGVESDVVTSTFWVSKEEPTSTLLLPEIIDTKRETVKLVGTSSDENGIDSVYVSTDNGVSYQKAIGQEDWTYTFNTKNIKDGTYSLFIKAIDKLQTEGFYATLINIDNTPPELIINQPVDGDILSDAIEFSGRSMDNVALHDVRYKIYSHSDDGDGIKVDEGILETTGIFNIKIPLEGYDPGDYNIELSAVDMAENRSISTRNFTVTVAEKAGDIEMLFPQPGSVLTSEFEVAGQVLGKKQVDFVELYIDNELFSEIKVNEFNYFNLKVNTLQLSNGEHKISLKTVLDDGQIYETPNYDIIVENRGAWLNIVNMKTGENISGRPFLTGEAGYLYDVEPPEGEKRIVPELVEVSLDNGQIFETATGSSEWMFRIETWQYEDGLTPVLVRAYYSNGETKTDRIFVNIDRTMPEVSVIEDLEQGRFNDSISISGTATDTNGLTDISVVLREGDKSNYEVPSLFQGMFIDAETGYGKVYGVGIGLTFFDDNVKIQGTFGETRADSDTARIYGAYYGFKLLANLYSLNIGSLLGPDFYPYSVSAAVGASFTNKTLAVSEEETTMWFSAVLAQIEFFKMSFDNDYISSVSTFIDLEATLISSENDGGFNPRIGLGTRVTLF